MAVKMVAGREECKKAIVRSPVSCGGRAGRDGGQGVGTLAYLWGGVDSGHHHVEVHVEQKVECSWECSCLTGRRPPKSPKEM